MIGALVADRYELTGRLAEGPVFDTYAARDRTTHQDVGLRVVRPPFAQDPEFLAGLRTAVSRQSGLVHPNVETLAAVGDDPEHPFVVGDVTRAPSLAERIRKLAPYTPQVAIRIVASVLAGLEALHRNGIVHGDVAPANVAFLPNGDGKLQLAGVWEPVLHSPDGGPAVLPGMAPYLAPEVLTGLPTASSDVYSVGVVLFELLTGRTPYAGPTAAATARMHRDEETPDLRAHNPAVPVALAQMVARAMEKEPARRYPSASAFRKDLLRLLDALRFGRPLATEAEEAPRPEPVTVRPDARGSLGRAVGDPAPVRDEAPPVAPKMTAARGEEPETPRRPRKDRDVPVWMLLLLAVFGAGAVSLIGAWLAFNLNRPKLVEVPRLTSLSVSEARALLDPLKLTLRVSSREPNDKVEADHVLQVNPDERSKVREGSSVYVVVSAGSRFVQIPDLKGFTPDRARTVLEGLGLRVDPTTDERDGADAPAGTVVGQDPGATTRAERGTFVRLTLARGGRTATSPDVPAGARTYEYSVSAKIVGVQRPVRVRIEIQDLQGTRTVFEDRLSEGRTAEVVTKGVGPQATFRIYYDDELVKEFVQDAPTEGGTETP